jgi:hypothetical protein
MITRNESMQGSDYLGDLRFLADEGLLGEAVTATIHTAHYGVPDIEALLAAIRERKTVTTTRDWEGIEGRLTALIT